MSSSFWYHTNCKIWLYNRVLTIWMEAGMFWKVANATIQQHNRSAHYLLCTVEWLHLQHLKTYLSPFKWSEPNPSSLVSKWRGHSPASHKLLICLIWSIFVKIENVQELFCWVYTNNCFTRLDWFFNIKLLYIAFI